MSTPREPFDLDALRPSDTPEYMTPAWLDCIRWAIQEPGIVEAFRAETGETWQPGRTGFEQAIDEATGADRAAFSKRSFGGST